MTSNDIKNQAMYFGAKVCGIGSIERFSDAPSGFGPMDLFPNTKSVIAFAKHVPKGALNLQTNIPYTVIEDTILFETHLIAVNLMKFIEEKGFDAVIVPSEPYEYWDETNKTGKGLVSLKHLAYKCGLGVFGKNHLLYNPKLGSLMKLGAVLTSAVLEPDDILEYTICKQGCKLCFTVCPGKAISETGVLQIKCRENSIQKTAKGDVYYACNACRRVCPNINGFKI